MGVVVDAWTVDVGSVLDVQQWLALGQANTLRLREDTSSSYGQGVVELAENGQAHGKAWCGLSLAMTAQPGNTEGSGRRLLQSRRLTAVDVLFTTLHMPEAQEASPHELTSSPAGSCARS